MGSTTFTFDVFLMIEREVAIEKGGWSARRSGALGISSPLVNGSHSESGHVDVTVLKTGPVSKWLWSGSGSTSPALVPSIGQTSGRQFSTHTISSKSKFGVCRRPSGFPPPSLSLFNIDKFDKISSNGVQQTHLPPSQPVSRPPLRIPKVGSDLAWRNGRH